MGLFTKLFGTRSEREVKKLEPQVEAVMALEEPYKKLTDQQLREKTQEFKDRLATGETLDDLLPEAFAVCREAASRVLGMRPYRVQVVGGIVLHQGRIAEMKTGEGKTLVAILPAYLNALTGNGVHIVTVNDYLAKRDSEWMGKVYRFLGLTVGATATAEAFLNFRTLGILVLGVVAFAMGTAGGLLLAKLMNVFSKDGNKINPLIGSAGVSAVPMAARVSQTEGQKENPSNYLLMHAMGPNVAGVVGSAVAAGILLSFLG